MSNPLFQMFGGQNQHSQQNTSFGNPMQMMQEFNRFRSTFQGNPQQKVQELLDSGKMSQEQFNQLSSMAQIFRQFLGK